MAEYQVNMSDAGDAEVIDLDSGVSMTIARSEIPYVARDLLAIMGYRTDYTRDELYHGIGWHGTERFAQVSA